MALRHERLYGHGYQGPSSEETFNDLTGRLRLRADFRVLDVGSGLGGDAFRLAVQYGVSVLGLDSSAELTDVCLERIEESGTLGVTFATGDVRDSDLLTDDSFDIVWSRDCVVFVPLADKLALWRRLHRVLRPGGQVMVTDYCLGPRGGSSEHTARMAAWDHYMISPAAYQTMLTDVGFTEVKMEDLSSQLKANMLEGHTRLLSERACFLEEMGKAEYERLLSRWERKINSCDTGEIVWTVLTARRPGEAR
ncbi:methyltransferase domain-containing protein [Actinacidiphila glaucinigra]|uniref:methyltransferase domain-containing protein n=1 Tax=Actinacidiphila glaucinigra TaxID=235986 RepID=UPI001C6579F4|nr:methyltransferase domain-containing protein [Actinacidiphila glaucinigra]